MNEFLNWNDFVKYKGRDGIDWKKNVGKTLNFIFNDENHSLTIKEVCERMPNQHSRNIVVVFDNGKERSIRAERLKQMNFCKIYPIDTHHFDIGDIVKGMVVKNVFSKKRNGYNWHVKMYTVQCLTDKCVFDIAEAELDKLVKCPVCSNKRVVEGINDIATTHPWMVQYLKNKDDATKYTAKSGKTAICICPICGKERTTTFEVLHRYGFRCNYCSDKISYPNKLMTAVLIQLENNGVIESYKREYKSDWMQGRFYDHYFILDNKNFLVEMDGGFHYRDNTYTGRSVSYTKEIDGIKDKLAASNGFELIRVDCNYDTIKNRFGYITKNIKLSMDGVLDLSQIDWNCCENFAASNLVKEICELYSNGVNRKELQARYPFISNVTIGTYLAIGDSCGLCDYNRNVNIAS